MNDLKKRMEYFNVNIEGLKYQNFEVSLSIKDKEWLWFDIKLKKSIFEKVLTIVSNEKVMEVNQTRRVLTMQDK